MDIAYMDYAMFGKQSAIKLLTMLLLVMALVLGVVGKTSPLHIQVTCDKDVTVDEDCTLFDSMERVEGRGRVEGVQVNVTSLTPTLSSLKISWQGPVYYEESIEQTGYATELEMLPKNSPPSRKCFIINNLDRNSVRLKSPWVLECSDLLTVQDAAYNVSVHPIPPTKSSPSIKTQVAITSKHDEYKIAAYRWGTDITAQYYPCLDDLHVTFQTAPRSFGFKKYQVRLYEHGAVIQSESLNLLHPEHTHLTHVLKNVPPGKYNITIAAVETGSGANCVCQCDSIKSPNCYSVPGCPSWAVEFCYSSKSTFIYASEATDFDHCERDGNSDRHIVIAAFTAGFLLAIFLLSLLGILIIRARDPKFEDIFDKHFLKRLYPCARSTGRKVSVSLNFWIDSSLSEFEERMKNLATILERFTDCDIQVEMALDKYPDPIEALYQRKEDYSVVLVIVVDEKHFDSLPQACDGLVYVVFENFYTRMHPEYQIKLSVLKLGSDLKELMRRCTHKQSGEVLTPNSDYRDILMECHPYGPRFREWLSQIEEGVKKEAKEYEAMSAITSDFNGSYKWGDSDLKSIPSITML